MAVARVHHAGLHRGVGPGHADRLVQTPPTVTAHAQRVGEAPISGLAQHRRPLLGHRHCMWGPATDG